MQSVTNLAGAAMQVYDKVVYDQVFKQNILAQNLRKNLGITSADGTSKILSVHHGRNSGHAAGSETITLPTAGQQSYKQATVSMKYNFQTIQLTDVVLEASKSNKAFLVNALDSEYEGAKNDMQRQISRQWWGLGTGELAQVVSLSTNTLVLDTPMSGKNPLDYIEGGEVLLLGSTPANIVTVDYQVGESATVVGQGTIELVTGHGVTPSENDIVYFARSATENNKDAEMSGLKLLVDDGTLATAVQGLNRVTTPPYYTWWRAYADYSSSQRALTEKLMQKTFLNVKKYGTVDMSITSFDLFNTYGMTMTPDRRYVGKDTMDLYGGFTGIKFNDTVIMPDFDCPYDEMYFIDSNALSIEELTPVSFMDKDGSILSRSSTTPAYQGTLRYYANLAVNKPRALGKLADVV